MNNGTAIYDDFLADAPAVRAHALASQFSDWPGPDGEVYQRICMTDVPGLVDALTRAVGPVQMLGMAYRLNFAGERPNAAVHSDLGWGTHALVLYLCDGPGGTAFWRHRATGVESIDPGDEELFDRVRGDWNRDDAWDLRSVVDLRFNRAIVYESKRFHSRYPFAAFGDGAANGRLTAVAFFSLAQEGALHG